MNEKKIEVIYILNYFQANIEKLNELRYFVTKNKSTISLLGKKEMKNVKKNNFNFFNSIEKLIYGKVIMITSKKKLKEHEEFTTSLVELTLKLNLHINAIFINKEIYLNLNSFLSFLNQYQNINGIREKITMPYQIVYFFNFLKNKQMNLINSIKKTSITNFNSYNKLIKYII